MNRTKSEQIVREAVVQALCVSGTRSEQSLYKRAFEREIRLADVLLAMQKINNQISIGVFGDFFEQIGYEEQELIGSWNLRADTLSEQSDSTIHFLAELFSKQEYFVFPLIL